MKILNLRSLSQGAMLGSGTTPVGHWLDEAGLMCIIFKVPKVQLIHMV